MRAVTALSSVGRAFAYLIGMRPRILGIRNTNIKRIAYPNLKLNNFSPNRNFDSVFSKKSLKDISFNIKNKVKSIIEDFTVIFAPVEKSPKVNRFGNVECKTLHRVNIRSVLQAISTTESVDFCGELEVLNTTHSSYIDSEESADL